MESENETQNQDAIRPMNMGTQHWLLQALDRARIALKFYAQWMATQKPGTDYPFGKDCEKELTDILAEEGPAHQTSLEEKSALLWAWREILSHENFVEYDQAHRSPSSPKLEARAAILKRVRSGLESLMGRHGVSPL
jgi:hypothetical protein